MEEYINRHKSLFQRLAENERLYEEEKENEMKEKIVELLISTNRNGIENLIQYMDENGFFTAPCSTQYHLAKDGGLAEHSFNVFEKMLGMNGILGYPEELNSIIITSMLHDLGKIGQYGKQNYVENILKSGKRSEAKPYTSNSDLMYVDHEVRSVVIAQQFIELTEEEQQAILWHNGLYGTFKYQIQGKEFPLYLLLHFADMWASRVIEKEGVSDEV